MKDRDNNDPVGFVEKMNCVGKTFEHRSTNQAAHSAKKCRPPRDESECTIHRGLEFQAEAGTFTLIPSHRFVVFDPGDRTKDDFVAHDVRPYFVSVATLISLHRTTSFGCV